jgi:hypothetical protein
MEPIHCSETSAISTQTPGKHPKENIFHLTHSESLKSRNTGTCLLEQVEQTDEQSLAGISVLLERDEIVVNATYKM